LGRSQVLTNQIAAISAHYSALVVSITEDANKDSTVGNILLLWYIAIGHSFQPPFLSI
jgi:hypothetical protein